MAWQKRRMNMENETTQGTLRVIDSMDNTKLSKEITFDLVWQGGQTLLTEIRKLVDIPDGLELKIVSERWASRTNVMGFELSLTTYSHYGSTHLFRRVMLKPRIDKYSPTSTIDLASIRSKVAELLPSVLNQRDSQQRAEQKRQQDNTRRKTNAPILARLAEQHGWECEISDSIYQTEDVKISRQTDIGEINIVNGYGDVKVTITLKDYDPTTIEKLVHFLSK
jgi:hypothetical protein